MKKRYIKLAIAFLSSSFFLFLTIIIAISILINSAVIDTHKKKTQSSSALGDLPKLLTYEIIAAAVENYEEYGVPTAITLAQIILESKGSYPLPDGNYSRLAWESKNLFGIKGQGNLGSDNYVTREEKDKKSYYIQSEFAKYSSFKESIKAHGRLLSSNFYKSKVKDKASSDSWADALQGTYATSSVYAKSLKDIMKSYNLYRFDNIKMHSLKALLEKDKMTSTSEVSSEKQNKIVAVAKSYSNNPYYHGYRNRCEAWVGDVYEKAGLSYSRSHCAAYARDRFATQKGKIPIGALIYSGNSYKSSVICECGRNAGHVGIYIGNGRVLSSQPNFNVSLEEFTKYYGYGGWSFSSNKIKI